MINSTSLKHINVQAKLFAALRKVAVLGHSVCHINNRKGYACIAVRYSRGAMSPFSFLDNKGRDITKAVLKALRNH